MIAKILRRVRDIEGADLGRRAQSFTPAALQAKQRTLSPSSCRLQAGFGLRQD
jgi:hypothetical protein